MVIGVLKKENHKFPHDNKRIGSIVEFILFLHFKDSFPGVLINREIFLLIDSFEEPDKNDLGICVVAPVSDNFEDKINVLYPSFVVVLTAEDFHIHEVFGVFIHVGYPVADLFVGKTVEGVWDNDGGVLRGVFEEGEVVWEGEVRMGGKEVEQVLTELVMVLFWKLLGIDAVEGLEYLVEVEGDLAGGQVAIFLETGADKRVFMERFVQFDSFFADDALALFSSDLFVEVAKFFLKGLMALWKFFGHFKRRLLFFISLL